jgi:hypothetical protein
MSSSRFLTGKNREVNKKKNTAHHFILPLIIKTVFKICFSSYLTIKNWLCFGFARAKQSQFITLDQSLMRRALRRARRFFRQG